MASVRTKQEFDDYFQGLFAVYSGDGLKLSKEEAAEMFTAVRFTEFENDAKILQ